jgi:hypothetical protein
MAPALASTTRSSDSSQTFATSPIFKERNAGFSACMLQIFVCAVHPENMVGLGGLEPPASPLSGVRSNHLSYRPNVLKHRQPDGGASRDRTDDPLLAKQVLSQLSYGPQGGRSPAPGRKSL